MARRWLAIAAGIPAALLLFAIFIIIFTPAATLQGVVDRAFKSAGYTFRAAEFGKALPLGIKARNLELADERGVLFRADDAVVRLRLLPLLARLANRPRHRRCQRQEHRRGCHHLVRGRPL